MNVNSTICALSTPPGVGAIALIRVSGKDAIGYVQQLFSKDISSAKGYTVHFGKIISQNEIIDEVIVTVFRNPHSFTGEDSVEIACHGSIYIQQRILALLIQHGCQMAEPGEFSKRAFYNGKLDLTQTEAIADLIHAESESAHRIAINQMKGGITLELATLRSELMHFASLVELELDFAEEDVEFADRKELEELLTRVIHRINELCDTFKYGNAIKNGIQVAIVGKPNAGKSSWINALVNDDVAIVSDIAGTTRDKIEVPITIEGQLFRFIDTAGLRETEDIIEGIGIKRAEEVIQKASIIIYLMDIHTLSHDEIETAISHIRALNKDGEIMLLANKADTYSEGFTSFGMEYGHWDMATVSANRKDDISFIKKELVKKAQLNNIDTNQVVITNARHLEALTAALTALEKTHLGLTSNVSGDFIAMDIRQAIHQLGSITGEITSDDLLGNIFKNFCIGK